MCCTDGQGDAYLWGKQDKCKLGNDPRIEGGKADPYDAKADIEEEPYRLHATELESKFVLQAACARDHTIILAATESGCILDEKDEMVRWILTRHENIGEKKLEKIITPQYRSLL